MPNAEKTAAVAEISDAFRDSSAAVLTEYRGLSVAQLKELRRSLAGNATYAVVKNTLTKIAMREAGLPDLSERLTGPTAIAFVTGDPVIVAKGLRDFARTHPLLLVKGGVLDGRPLSAEEVRTLADLESREVLLARMAGAMKASLSQAVAVFVAPLAQVARLAAALQEKATEDPSILRGGAGTPAAAEVADATDGAEVPDAAEPADGAGPTDSAGRTDGAEPASVAEPDAVTPEPVTDVAPETAGDVAAEPVAAEPPAAEPPAAEPPVPEPVAEVTPEPAPADAVIEQPTPE